MAKIGYNPRAQADFLSSLNREHALQQSLSGGGESLLDGFFASHPNTLERVQRAAAAAVETGAPADAFYGRNEVLRRIDGLPYGDSAAQGFVRGRTFAHPKLRLQFTVPSDFRIVNQPQAVVAKGPGGAIIQFDNARRPSRSDPVDHLTREWGAKLPLRDVERLDVNGAPAATARARIRTQNGVRDVRLVVVRFPEGQLYRFVFLTPPELTARLAEELQRTTYSLRRLSEQEAAALKGRHIRVVEIRAGDSVESLAQRMVGQDHPNERFRVLNALEPATALRPGEKVKIIA
jgi:predicted Zn-dependent protease